MKNLDFKNFNYSFIDSARVGYKEILVTYIANNQRARHILFIKEVKGKSNAYYINEAKKQIESQIDNGELAKSASKQIKHANSKGILKPVMVTLSAVLGVGALGAGGYFTYKYFTNPGGGDVPPGPGPEPTTGHTVVLMAGEGQFEGGLNYLVLKNVVSGTALGDIEGYVVPTYQNYDFDKWIGTLESGYTISYKILSDVVLTATYHEGINYTRDVEITKVNEELSVAIKELTGQVSPDTLESVNGIANRTITMINSEEAAKSENSVAMIQDLSSFCTDTIQLIVDHSDNENFIGSVTKIYDKDLDKIITQENDAKRFSIIKNCTGYFTALDVNDELAVEDSYLDIAFDDVERQILSAEDDDEVRLLGYMGTSLQIESRNIAIKDPKSEKIYLKKKGKLLKEKTNEAKSKIKKGDVKAIEWVGDMAVNESLAIANLDNSNVDQNYKEYISTVANENFDSALQFIENGSEDSYMLAQINVRAELVKTFAEIEANNLPKDAQVFQTAFGLCEKKFNGYYESELIKDDEQIGQAAKTLQSALKVYAKRPPFEYDPTFEQYLFGYYEELIDDKSYGLVQDQLRMIANDTGYVKPIPKDYIDSATDIYFTAMDDAIILADAIKEKTTESTIADLAERTYFAKKAVAIRLPNEGLVNTKNVKYIARVLKAIPDGTLVNNRRYDETEIKALMRFFEPLAKIENEELANYYSDIFYAIISGENKADALYGGTDLSEGILLPSSEAVSSILPICYKSNPNATNHLVDLLENIYGDYSETTARALTMMLMDQEAFVGTFNEIINGTALIISKKVPENSTQNIKIFDAYFSTYDDLFKPADKLVREGVTEQHYYSMYLDFMVDGLNNYFQDYFDKAPELKIAINENLTSKITDTTGEDDLKKLIAATKKACDQIVSGK